MTIEICTLTIAMEDDSQAPTLETHPALRILERLLAENEITEAVSKELTEKFAKLQNAFRQACETEKKLMRKAREMNKDLKVQKLTIQSSAAQEQEHRTQLALLRQATTNVQTELDATQEQINLTTSNTQAKKKELEKLEQKVKKAQNDQVTKLDPQKKAIQAENTNLEESIRQRRAKIDSLVAEKESMLARIKECEKQLNELESKKRAANQKVLEISSIPLKVRQQASTVESSLQTLLAEERQAVTQLEQANTKIDSLYTKSHDIEVEYQHVKQDLDGVSDAMFAMARKCDKLRQQIQDTMHSKTHKEYELGTMRKVIGEQEALINSIDQHIDNVNKEMERRRMEILKMEEAIARMELEKDTMKGALTRLHENARNEKKLNARRNDELTKTEEAKENALKALLRTEQVTADVMNKIKEELKAKDSRQYVADRLSKKQSELTQQLQETVVIRNRKAREIAAMKSRVQDVRGMVVERNLHLMELGRELELYHDKIRDSAELYEKVKMERNRYVNAIQTSQQLVVELNEKIKLLQNGVEVLQTEYAQVELAVKMQKNELSAAMKRREVSKNELKKAEAQYRELQTKIDYQANETNRMNRILQRIEDQINTQQSRYSVQADDCANIQRLLIDKQDELCLIYEQYNRHEEVMRRGEKALKDREDELRVLNLELADFVRKIDVYQKKIPELRKCDEKIEELKEQIAREQKDVDDLTTRLEVPDKKERKRHYSGKDFSHAELDEKIQLYEQRVKGKEQQKAEALILLSEIEGRIESMKSQAQKNAATSSRTLERGGNIRAQTMATRRKKMAALSEMAIYQAQQGELQEEKQAILEEIQAAEARTARGEAFDETAGRMMRMHERDIRTAQSPKRRSIFDSDDEDEEPRAGRQKFDAYPTADGLSRPYGAYPVFQPGPPSANLRYYKKEGQRPIVL